MTVLPTQRLQVVRIPSWSSSGWLIHGFSTRIGGKTTIYRQEKEQGADLNLGFTDADDRGIVTVNRDLFLRAATGRKRILGMVTLRQIHSSLIRRVDASDVQADDQPAMLEGDGLMTNAQGVLLGIQTADCIPILVADRKNRAVAAFHAGWRGTLGRIVEKGVGRMRLEFGSRPEHLVAAIGPGIGQCCYSVGDELQQQFQLEFAYATELFRAVDDADPVRENGPAMHLDLAEANRRQLLAAGLKKSAIAMTGLCTGCQTDRFFSHRVERGFTGRMMSVIGIACED